MVGLLILLASMGLLIFLIVQFGKSFPEKMADMIGFGDESGEKEPETEDGVVPSENLPVGAAAPKQ